MIMGIENKAIKDLIERINKPRTLIAIGLIVLVILGFQYMRYVWTSSKIETSEYVLRIARTAEATFQKGALTKLEVSQKDIEKSQYQSLKNSLAEVVKINKDIRFAYIYTMKDDKLYFIVDSESVESKDYSPPGQEYTEADKAYSKPFKNGNAVITTPLTDRWGTWVSVLVPMRNFETGKITAVFAMDYPANTWNEIAYNHTVNAGIVVLVLILLLLSFYIILNKNIILNKEKNKLEIAKKESIKASLIIERVNNNFNSFFNTINDMLFVLDTEGKIIHTNNTVLNRLEYSEEEIIGKSVLMVHPENKREEAGKIVENMLAGKKDFCTIPVITKSGKEIPVETRIVMGEWNGVPALFGVVKDVSEIKKSEEKFSRAFQSNAALMAISTVEDGRYIDVNDTFLKMLGFDREEVIGKKSVDLDLFLDREQREIIKNEFENKGKVENVEVLIKGKNGIFLNGIFSVDSINLGETPCWISTLTDITKQKQVESELIIAKERAEVATIMKSQFLANMSHEIRTPMNGIMGFLQLMQRTDMSDDQKDFIKEAQSASEVLLYVINDILDFSKIEAGKLTIDKIGFRIRTAIEEAVSLLVPKAAEKNIELHTMIKASVPEEVIGDPSRLRQILNNLLSNALKFTESGEVSVAVDCIEEEDEIALIRFEVKDTGIGISQEDIQKLFQSFNQADASTTRKYGGTGLGLAISKELVQMMEGNIHVESIPGEGSTFIFDVRLKISKRASEQKLVFEKLEAVNVLVVDDNTNNRKIVNTYLEEAGCKVFEAKDAVDAMTTIISNSSTKNKISIAVIDYQMPGMSGYEMASSLKTIPFAKDVKLILLTSAAQKGGAKEAKQLGFSGYLTKPVRRDDLVNCIAVVLGLKNEEEKHPIVTKYIVKESIDKNKPKILLVEDNEINRKLIIKMLKMHELTCDVAMDGKEASEAVLKKDYDIIFMDCQMPIMDGYESTAEIRKFEDNNKHATIIAMTANVLEGDRDKCIEAGMDDYISKPIDFEIMFKMIEDNTKNGKRG